MSADKEFTYSDVSEHNTKKDLYIVVHDKVYNASSFVDEHPYVSLPCTCPPRNAPHLGIRILILVMAKSPAFTCVGSMVTATVANTCTEVVRRFFLMSEARTQQKLLRMLVTRMKLVRSSMGCLLET